MTPHLKFFLSWGLMKGWGRETEEERKLFQKRGITTYKGVRTPALTFSQLCNPGSLGS